MPPGLNNVLHRIYYPGHTREGHLVYVTPGLLTRYAGSDVIIEDLAIITLPPLVHKMFHCLHNDYVYTVLAVTTSMFIYSLCNNTMSVFVCYTFIYFCI